LKQWGKDVLKSITAWAEKEYITVLPNTVFTSDVECFLSQEIRRQLAKDAHEIMSITQLRLALEGWPFFNTHGEALFTELRCAYRSAKDRAIKTPIWRRDMQESSQCSQGSIQYSQSEVIWTPSSPQSTRKHNPLSELSTNTIQKCLKQEKQSSYSNMR
jgi:hypothetical protein